MARRLVSFIIAGAQKAGTTALDSYLREHADVCMADKKELHFFDDERRFRKRPSYRAYHAHFRHASEDQILGEATPIYMYWYAAPRRMWEYNPSLRILVILRNPIERAYSHWTMERQNETDHVGFLEAVVREAERRRTAVPLQHRFHSYVDRGFYSEQLRRLWHFFPPDQTLVLRSERLRQDPGGTLDDVCDFLGVARLRGVSPREEFRTEYASPLPDEARRRLIDVYRWEVREVERLLGWDCSAWLE